MSPFGEIRSALDLLNLHVMKVDNIVPNTGIVATMQTLLKSTVKTQVRAMGCADVQMAGSFDVCRAELLIMLQRQQAAVDALPLFSKPAPVSAVSVVSAAVSAKHATEPTAPAVQSTEPTVPAEPAASAEPTATEPAASTAVQSTEPAATEPSVPAAAAEPTAPTAEQSTEPEAEKKTDKKTEPAPPRTSRSDASTTSRLVKDVSTAVCAAVETLLRRMMERLNSMLSLVQMALPAAIAGFTKYFYTQVQQTLLWFLALLLKAQNVPHALLYGEAKVLGDAEAKCM